MRSDVIIFSKGDSDELSFFILSKTLFKIKQLLYKFQTILEQRSNSQSIIMILSKR